jgi:conjugal transfer/type IV secretion protein DotA/TraY
MAVADLKHIKVGSVARYMLLPQILPRLNAFYTAGFAQLAFFIALTYRSVGILPRNHYVLRPENRDTLGLRQVLAAAGAELKFTRSEIDKVVIYFAVIVGLLLLAGQFLLLLTFVMMNPALAQVTTGTMPTTYAGFFATPNYQYDVAYNLLYMVFGVPELFNPSGPVRPFHTALYSLFQLYSIGLLVIALIIAAYMIFAILVETAQTGVPFGKRYNQAWAPIRFVFALGLLIPIGYGLNSAQWITLYAAKFGSDFATKGWILFNDTMVDAYLDKPQQRVGRPQAPEMTELAAFMSTVAACEFAYEKMYTGGEKKDIEPYLIKNAADVMGKPPTIVTKPGYTNTRDYFNKGDILIRFGEYEPKIHPKWLGHVYPYCGDLVIFSGDAVEPGAEQIQDFYYKTVQKMWGSAYDLRKTGEELMALKSDDERIRAGSTAAEPPTDFKSILAKSLEKDIQAAIKTAVDAQAASATWQKDQAEMARRGWGGAGIWYNKIAQINGSLVTATNNVPSAKMMPFVMEYVKAEQLQQNTEVTKMHDVVLADGREIQFNSKLDRPIGKGLAAIQDYWHKEDLRQDDIGNQTRKTNNIFIDTVNLIFGTRGLFDMCASADVHPLAQLSILGKGLVEASIRNLGLAVGGGLLTVFGSFIGVAGGAAAKFLMMVASITITMGFVLFYIIPFMPFLYFFFAVGGWIKGLFEAMVGVPLWALAHMRIDGEGLPGDAAISGYFLIFEIFLRPILIIFGLLASVVIFAAMVKVLNEIFYLVVTNLAGHDENIKQLCGYMSSGGATGGTGGGGATGGGSTPGPGGDAVAFFRGPIDELFFTILYALIVYMIGMSCFKLIDLIPNNLLRYMNISVSTFNDVQNDPAQGLIAKLGYGGSNISNQVLSIGQSGMSAAGNGLNALTQLATGGGKPPQG